MNTYWALSLALVSGTLFALPIPPERMKAEAPETAPVIVEDEATAAKARIRNEAITFLAKRDYRALDALAAQLRASTQTFARGDWPITLFYFDVAELPDSATHSDWEMRMQLLRDWFESDPDSMTARVAMAYGLVGYAWDARGSGWASEVGQDGWRLFHQRLTEARRILIAAESIATKCPVFYSTRLGVALGDGTTREGNDQLFEEAVSAFPTYTNYYRNRAYYLLPRWHGEPGEWEGFAEASADRLGGEAGDVLYAQIIWSMHDSRVFGNMLKEANVNWPRIQNGFEALCRRYPNSISAQSEYCSISGFAPQGARQMMRRLFSKLGDRVDLSVWIKMEYWQRDHNWAFSN